MANHKSAEKRARQSARKTVVNNNTRKTVRTYEKKLRAAIDQKDKKLAEQLFKEFSSKIDTAVKKRVVHERNASRKIGRVAQRLSALSA